MVPYKNEFITKEDLAAIESVELKSLFASGNSDVVMSDDHLNKCIASYGKNKNLQGIYQGYWVGLGVAAISLVIGEVTVEIVRYFSPRIKLKIIEHRLKKAAKKEAKENDDK